MFGMGWQEILLILVIAVLVIGPDQLPQVARTIGKLIAQFRRFTNDMRDSLNKEFSDREDLKDFKEFHQSIDTEFRTLSGAAQNYVNKEVAKEEEELKKLEKEVQAAADPASLGDAPGEPRPAWATTVDDFPPDATAAVPTDSHAEPGANGSHDPAAAGGSNGSGMDSGDAASTGAGPRKESA